MEKMPVLSSRIHRLPEGEVDDGAEQQAQTLSERGFDTTWTFKDAETRLSAAYDKSGFSGWAGAALNELEAEAERDRMRRERLLRENNPT